MINKEQFHLILFEEFHLPSLLEFFNLILYYNLSHNSLRERNVIIVIIF